MTPPFAQFILKHVKKDENGSKQLSLAGLMIVYQTWSKTPLKLEGLFDLLTIHLGHPTQGDKTSPPGKIFWTGWQLAVALLPPPLLSHTGIKGEEKSVLNLAQQRGFDKCPVCLQLIMGRAIITECGHKFCPDCIRDLKKYAPLASEFECPLCRTPTKKLISASLIYRNIKQFNCPAQSCFSIDMNLDEFENHIWFLCNSRKIQCKCGQIILASAWSAHEKSVHYPPLLCPCGEYLYINRNHSCQYTKIKCKKCNKLVTQNDLNRHLQTTCNLAKECKCCGLPGTIEAVTLHQEECTISNCIFCDEIFRIDKLPSHHSVCSQRPFKCVVEGCTKKMSFDDLKTHFTTDHPVLADTGIFTAKKNSLFLLRDAQASPCIGRKIDETDDMIKFTYIGWNIKYDEWIPKSSSRFHSLEDNIDKILSDLSYSIFPRIFIKGGLGSLIKNDLLSHKDVELLCFLEQTYKNLNIIDEEEKNYCVD